MAIRSVVIYLAMLVAKINFILTRNYSRFKTFISENISIIVNYSNLNNVHANYNFCC